MQRAVKAFDINDIDLMINYFLQGDEPFLRGMGVEPSKLPDATEWRDLLLVDFEQPLAQKKFYYVLWELDQAPIGHSNINKIVYGQEAYMHLHLWHSQKRKGGHGTFFIQESINRYFELFHLQNLFCEPYALNPAPNKTLAKAGFELLKTYETTPGWINFNQPVNRWVLTKETWLQASKSNKLRTSAAPQAGGLGG